MNHYTLVIVNVLVPSCELQMKASVWNLPPFTIDKPLLTLKIVGTTGPSGHRSFRLSALWFLWPLYAVCSFACHLILTWVIWAKLVALRWKPDANVHTVYLVRLLSVVSNEWVVCIAGYYKTQDLWGKKL